MGRVKDWGNRKDDNHAQILRTLERLAVPYKDTSALPNFVDVIAWLGCIVLIEIKDGSKAPSARKLTKGEANFWQYWPGMIHKVESQDDVIALVNLFRKHQPLEWVRPR